MDSREVLGHGVQFCQRWQIDLGTSSLDGFSSSGLTTRPVEIELSCKFELPMNVPY